MSKIKIIISCMTAMTLAGCASKASDVSASYVSPLAYQGSSCAQLGAEAQRISARASELSGLQDSKVTRDTVATTVAVVIFWPAAFLVGGDNAQTAELARMKGEMSAIERASIEKKCSIAFR